MLIIELQLKLEHIQFKSIWIFVFSKWIYSNASQSRQETTVWEGRIGEINHFKGYHSKAWKSSLNQILVPLKWLKRLQSNSFDWAHPNQWIDLFQFESLWQDWPGCLLNTMFRLACPVSLDKSLLSRDNWKRKALTRKFDKKRKLKITRLHTGKSSPANAN